MLGVITRQRVAKALAVGALILASGLAHADFKSNYSDGIKAADKANWANARAKMQSALALEPNPQARVRIYGMRFDPYIPHYYLALAAFKLGDCAGAIGALNNPAHQSIMQQAKGVEDQLAQSKLILSQCSANLAVPVGKPLAPVVAIGPGNVPNRAPISTKPAPDPQIAADAAAKALALEALASKTLALEAQLKRERDAKLAADRLAAQQASAPISPPVVVKPPLPAALARIAASYFAGNLKEAARSDLAGLSGKALAHALLLRAAAKHSVYQQQGAKSAEQLLNLKADLLSAKRADPAVKPTARYFNREFIGLYAAP